MVLDIPLMDALVITVLYFVSTTINAYFCYLMWRKRAVKPAMVKTFDELLGQTKIGKNLTELVQKIEVANGKIDKVTLTVENLDIPEMPDIPKIDPDAIAGKVWKKIQGATGGEKAALNKEMRGLEADVGLVVSEAYPGCSWMSDNLDLLIDLEFLDKSKADAFVRASQHPQVLENLEKGCLALKARFEGNGGTTASTGGRNAGRPRW